MKTDTEKWRKKRRDDEGHVEGDGKRKGEGAVD